MATLMLELAVPLLLGSVVCIYLHGATRRLLVDLCGTVERAEFWVRVSAVLTVAAPTVLVLAFGGSATGDAAPGEILRHALALGVVGVVVAVAVLARTIWTSIPKTTPAGGDRPCAS